MDSYRCIAVKNGTDVKCYTCSGLDWYEKYPAVVRDLINLDCKNVVLDGEIVSGESSYRSRFSSLQIALTDGVPLRYYVFDIINFNGRNIRNIPLIKRKYYLRTLVADMSENAAIKYSEFIQGNGQKVYEAMCKEGEEGLIYKDINSRYIGKRCPSWRKIKCSKRQEFVVGGYIASDKNRFFSSLLLGTYERGRLVYRGKVGTGFSDLDQLHIGKIIKTLSQNELPFNDFPKQLTSNAQ